ncbi:MAG: hypothetical protein QF482_04705 [Candidatus Poseidoniia archaeon]|nr:hypothetical protein [Candidatus Poseidoniia archaeon]
MKISKSKKINKIFLILVGFMLTQVYANPEQDVLTLRLQDAPQLDEDTLKEQEIEKELARIQAAFDEDEVLEEFIPSEPLSADIAVSFPSDI